MPHCCGGARRRRVSLLRDTHWTPAGTAAAAFSAPSRAALVRSGVGEQQFATVVQGEVVHHDDLMPFLTLAGRARERFGPELVRREATSPLAVAPTSGSALLATPSILVALVGTSYSADPLWNFAGALQVELAADVLVVAAEGCGPFLALQEYLASPTFAELPPALVIWEIPERYLSLDLGSGASVTQAEK